MMPRSYYNLRHHFNRNYGLNLRSKIMLQGAHATKSLMVSGATEGELDLEIQPERNGPKHTLERLPFQFPWKATMGLGRNVRLEEFDNFNPTTFPVQGKTLYIQHSSPCIQSIRKFIWEHQPDIDDLYRRFIREN
jgi:hypothetical protein